MIGKIITAIIIVVIISLFIFLFKDSNIKDFFNIKKIFSSKKPKVVLADEPIIKVKTKNEPYVEYVMTKPVFTIGSGFSCDLVINDSDEADFKVNKNIFEKKHLIIRKIKESNDIYFTITNLGKVNTTEYLMEKRYVYMDFKDEIELEGRSAFYVGDVKIVVLTPETIHYVEKSDIDHSKNNENKNNTTKIKSSMTYSDRVYDIDDIVV